MECSSARWCSSSVAKNGFPPLCSRTRSRRSSRGPFAEDRPRQLTERRPRERLEPRRRAATAGRLEHACDALCRLGTGRDDEADAPEVRALRRFCQFAGEVDRRRVGPLEVVEHDDDRRGVGDQLDHAAVQGAPSRRGRGTGALLRLRRLAGEPGGQAFVGRERGDDRTPRRVGAASVGVAAGEHPAGADDRAAGDLRDDRRLAHPRIAHERQHATFAGHVFQLGELLGPPDRGARHVAPLAHGVVASPDQAPHLDRLGLPLHHDRAHVFELEARATELDGQLADVDLSGRRRRLEALGDVHRVAQDGVGDVGGGAREAPHRVSGVHPDVHREGAGELGQELAQRVDLLEHLERRRQRPLGVVLRRRRQPEAGEERVAGVVEHRAAVARHDVTEAGDHGVDDLAEGLRIDLLGQGGEAGDVDEQRGQQAPLLARLAEPRQPAVLAHRRRTAVPAEARAIGVLAGARPALPRHDPDATRARRGDRLTWAPPRPASFGGSSPRWSRTTERTTDCPSVS